MTALTPESIREGIAAAEADISAAEALIRAKRAVITDFEAAQRSYDRLNPQREISSAARQNGEAHRDQPSAANPHRADTNKWYLWEALNKSERVWITANEAQAIASAIKGSEMPMTSVSPMLSDMAHADKTIVRDGLKVALPHRSQGILTAHVPQNGMLALRGTGEDSV